MFYQGPTLKRCMRSPIASGSKEEIYHHPREVWRGKETVDGLYIYADDIKVGIDKDMLIMEGKTEKDFEDDMFPFSTKTVSRSTARASARKCSTGFNRRELAGIEFAYDGEKSLFTVGALPQKKMEFIVVLDDITSSRNSGNSSPGHGSPNDGDRKRMKCPYHSKTFKVELSFAAKIPMQAIAMLCVVRNLKIRRVVCSFANRFSITIRRAFVRSEVVFLAVEGFTRALGPP